MTILKRIILDRCEVLPSGHIQIRHCIEEYDDTITPTPAVEGVYKQVEVSPAEAAIFEEIIEGIHKGRFREVAPAKAAVFETVTITEPVESITDIVEDVIFHRGVIAPGDRIIASDIVVDGVVMLIADVIAVEIEIFMQTHKMIQCKKFDLYDIRHPKE